MITANVKNVDVTAAVNLPQGPSGRVQAPGGTDSFQDILNKQTDTADSAKQADRNAGSGRRTKTEKTDTETNQVSRKDRTKDVESEPEPEMESAEPVEEAEEISEAAKEAAAQLLLQISDVFGVTVEELKGLMQEMGISEEGLLVPQQLGSLILEAGGAEGSFELVTDGELYEKFQNLMELREHLVGELSEETGMSREEVIQRLLMEPEEAVALETQGTEKIPESLDAQEPEAEPGKALQTAGMQQEAQKAETEGGESGRNPSRQESSGGEHREIPGGYENHPVMRQTTLETAVYEMRTESASQITEADTQNIMRQILDYMKVQIRPEATSLEMQLHPASLGTLQIQLASKGGAVTAQFIAESETVKAALESQMIQLRESFEEQGIRVEAIEVSVQTGRFEQAYEDQERNGEERQASRAKSGRRLRLDAQLTQEQPETMTADERLAADMMAANGGTVDYMA